MGRRALGRAPKARCLSGRGLSGLGLWVSCLSAFASQGFGCSVPSEGEPASTCGTECGDTLKDYWQKGDREDLLSAGAKFLWNEISDALAFSTGLVSGDARLESPTLYGVKEVADNDLTVKDIDTLVSGLATQLGERELTTEVNRIRQRYLRCAEGVRTDDIDCAGVEPHDNRYYAETQYRLKAGLGKYWSHAVPGLTDDDGSVYAGFNRDAAIEGRVIAAYGSELSAQVDGNPLGLLVSGSNPVARGFILPRGEEVPVADLLAMKPGEMFGASAPGSSGLYVGLSMPILVSQVVAGITYRLVLSVNIGVRLKTSRLDVDVVRLEGSDLIVDVGSSVAEVDSFEIRIEDKWILDDAFDLIPLDELPGPVEEIVQDAVESEIDSRLDLISARISQRELTTRLSIGRVRFRLDELDDAAQIALGQAMFGDLRLAQILHNEATPGVQVEFDLGASTFESSFYAGAEILGMNFFWEEITREGSSVIQTPDSVRTLLYNYLERNWGLFFWEQNFVRAGVSSLAFETGQEAPTGEANLFLRLADRDSVMDANKLSDHLEGILLAYAGHAAFVALEEGANTVGREVASVSQRCPTDDNGDIDERSCAEKALDDPGVRAAMSAAVERFERELPSSLDAKTRETLTTLARIRVGTESVYGYALFNGPRMDVSLDVVLGDDALNELMLQNGSKIATHILRYLQAAAVYRSHNLEYRAEQREALIPRNLERLNEIATAWDGFRALYAEQILIEDVDLPAGHLNGKRGLQILSTEQANETYAVPTAESFSQARARIATAAVDRLIEIVDAIRTSEPIFTLLPPERIAIYSLLGAVPSTQRDAQLDIELRDRSDIFERAGFESVRHISLKGEDARRIAIRPVNVETLILNNPGSRY